MLSLFRYKIEDRKLTKFCPKKKTKILILIRILAWKNPNAIKDRKISKFKQLDSNAQIRAIHNVRREDSKTYEIAFNQNFSASFF